jgi:hypothetical protein|tara:strand:- start:54 stop:338 length:285 start_codon:yes stop_codon:yes gene_type:complete
MAQQIGEDTKVTLDLKTLGMVAAGIGTVVAMWFALQADIAEAKELPVPPDPEISRMEFDMKDQLVRQTIMTTQDDVAEIKQDIKRIEEKIDQLK